MRLEISTNSDSVRQEFMRMASRTTDLKPIGEPLRKTVAASVRDNFKRGGDPPWMELKRERDAKDEASHPLLRATGRLFSEATRVSVSGERGRITFSADVGKAGLAHQFGLAGKTISVPASSRTVQTKRGKKTVEVKPYSYVSTLVARMFFSIRPGSDHERNLVETISRYILDGKA